MTILSSKGANNGNNNKDRAGKVAEKGANSFAAQEILRSLQDFFCFFVEQQHLELLLCAKPHKWHSTSKMDLE
jgi:hypothetical protein